MSQYVKVKSKIMEDVKPKLFEKALENMGFRINKDVKAVNDSVNELTDSVDFVLGVYNNETNTLNNYNIGIEYAYNDFGRCQATIKGDFWRTGYSQRTFINEMQRKYQELCIEEAHRSLYGGSLIFKEEQQDGTVVLRYAV